VFGVRRIIFVFAFLAILLPLMIGSSFATTYQVNIHAGAADPHAPVFLVPYQPLNININDTVEWGNGDTVPHELVSGTPSTGPDGKFDSGIIQPGAYFDYQFLAKDAGTVNYYDKIYPFITGVVNVGTVPTNFKVIAAVGKDVTNGSKSFDVQYSSPKDIVSAIIDPKQKAITFTLVGQVQGNNTLVLKLPNDLIGAPFIGVWVDNVITSNYQLDSQGGMNIVTIPLNAKSEEVSIVGTSIIPEFGPIAELVLAISIIATIIFVKFRPIHKLG